MSVCPWCKAPADANRPCPRCRKLAADHPSVSGGATLDTSFDDDVPALDLPALDTAGPISGAHRAAGAGATSGGAAELDPDDAFMNPAAGPSLELDVEAGGPGSLPPRVSGSMPSATPHAPRTSGTMPAAGPPAKMPAPPPIAPPMTAGAHGKPASDVAAIDPYDARALADYGEAPDKWWMTPLYAMRVLVRRPALKRLLSACKDDALRADAKLEDALVAFADRVRPLVERNPAHARALADVYTAEELLRSRDGALAAEMDAHRARVAQIDERIASLETELVGIEDEERKIADELSRVNAIRERAEAKMRRADIEIRNATAALEPAAGKGPGR